MDTKAFYLNIQAKYRAGGHFKEKAGPLSLANQEIMIDDKGSYQKTLGYASTLDFMCGIGLFLMPSDMALHPGNVQGYNNESQIAGSNAVIGHNPGINEAEPITSKGDKAFQGRPPH